MKACALTGYGKSAHSQSGLRICQCGTGREPTNLFVVADGMGGHQAETMLQIYCGKSGVVSSVYGKFPIVPFCGRPY